MSRTALGEQLSVITPVSRPELLRAVGASIPNAAEWIVVTDGALEIPDRLRPHVFIRGPRTNQWGDVQRAWGIKAATRPFVYFLDDDNLMLPSLPDLLIPFLNAQAPSGVLFGLVDISSNGTHRWTPPPQGRFDGVDTAMFLGEREAILQLQFNKPVPTRGWPNLMGRRWADFIFIQAYEARFGLTHLPDVYGFHNGVRLLQQLRPELFEKIQSEIASPVELEALIHECLICT